MYNILTDRLPDKVKIGSKEYPIKADFRTAIRFEILMRDKSIPDEEKIKRMVCMFFTVIPDNIEKAIAAVLWFYNAERNTSKEEEQDAKRGVKRKKKVISHSFSQDSAYIYASFMQQYGINLQRIADEDLHWWEFVALFDALGEDTQMGKVIYYRTVSTSGMSSERRKHVNEMKKLYALKDESSCDMRVALAKRNAEWKEYVKRRTAGMV